MCVYKALSDLHYGYRRLAKFAYYAYCESVLTFFDVTL